MRGGTSRAAAAALVAIWMTGSAGCSEESSAPSGAAEEIDSSAGNDDTNEATDSASEADAIGDDAVSESDGSGGETPEPEKVLCSDGVELTPFDAAAATFGYDLPVPDFTVSTLDGSFTLSEAWTGCEQFVFVLYNPNVPNVASFWATPVGALISDSAPNAQYLFVVGGIDEATRIATLEDLRSRLVAEIDAQSLQAEWADRLHFITDAPNAVPPVAAAWAVSPGELHFTIDRHQLMREGHNTAVATQAGWENQLEFVRYWAKYFNGQYALDEQLEAEEAAGDVFVHRIAEKQDIRSQGWWDNHPVTAPHTWTFPDAATMAEYGRLVVDMRVECPAPFHPYSVACGEWDTVGSMMLCTDADCTPENRRRIVKWITPYSAPGRWLFDISSELVHLAEGGALKFVMLGGDNDFGPYTYRYTIDLRFSEREDGLKPFASETLIQRGNYGWNEAFHDNWDDWSFTPPAGTKRVVLATRISGHGADSVSGCSEFCTFTHRFSFNDTPFAYTFEMDQAAFRCAERVGEGVVPNQGGTWFYDRSSWCPGFPIEEWNVDVTEAISLDGDNAISYKSGTGQVANGYPGGGNMDMRVELLYYR